MIHAGRVIRDFAVTVRADVVRPDASWRDFDHVFVGVPVQLTGDQRVYDHVTGVLRGLPPSGDNDQEDDVFKRRDDGRRECTPVRKDRLMMVGDAGRLNFTLDLHSCFQVRFGADGDLRRHVNAISSLVTDRPMILHDVYAHVAGGIRELRRLVVKAAAARRVVTDRREVVRRELL